MTALDQYQRLEAVALWRAAPDAQPREVVVSFGHATLTLMDIDDAPRAHWSLAALEEIGSDAHGLVLTPDPDGAETLSLDDPEMIAAIRAVRQPDPPPLVLRSGRIGWSLLVVLALLIAAIIAGREPLAERLVARIDDVTWERLGVALATEQMAAPGAAFCRVGTASALRSARGHPLLLRMTARLPGDGPTLRPVLARFDGPPVLGLPGTLVLVNAGAVEGADQPEQIAGLLALAQARQDLGRNRDALAAELGLAGAVRLALSGSLPPARRAQVLAALHRATIEDGTADSEALRLLTAAELPSLPLSLLLADHGAPRARIEELQAGDSIGAEVYTPALDDADWLRLGAACS